MQPQTTISPLRRVALGALALVGAVGFTATLGLILPFLQVISARETTDDAPKRVDTFQPPPPPPPPPEETPPEPEPEEPPAEPPQDLQPLSLEQLDLALSAELGGGALAGDFGLDLDLFKGAGGDGLADLTDTSDLDQAARPIYQAQPTITPEMRRKMPATVWLICMVDENGRVLRPKVESSDDPVFNAAALKAFKQWKFEPGKSGGKAVTSRVRIPMSFSQG